ncbi:hypothetical protein ACMHYB_39380 [Sorangium sp. So ce1128]
MPNAAGDVDVEALHDQLAREHLSDDYCDRSPLPIRLLERERLAILRDMLGDCAGLDLAEVGSRMSRRIATLLTGAARAPSRPRRRSS